VGAGRLHAVRLRSSGWGRLVYVDRLRLGSDLAPLLAFCEGTARIAIDAPSGFSAGAHLYDQTVAPKFRGGRCSEIPVPGVPAVPWITPCAGEPVPAWMAFGFEVWRTLQPAFGPSGPLGSSGLVETFPAACFHQLNGGRWPPRKTLFGGRAARVGLLASAGLSLPAPPGSWSHDDLDAAAAALVAAVGRPLPHECPAPDGSSLWLLPALGQ
jgi:hypothetical protein